MLRADALMPLIFAFFFLPWRLICALIFFFATIFRAMRFRRYFLLVFRLMSLTPLHVDLIVYAATYAAAMLMMPRAIFDAIDFHYISFEFRRFFFLRHAMPRC